MLSWWTNTKLVFCKDSEDVLLKFDQVHSFVCGLFDSGGQSVPNLTIRCTALNNVVGDPGSTIITWWVPGQETGLISDLGDVKGSRGTRFVYVREE